MTSYSVPYGKTNLTFDIPDHFQVDVIAPTAHPPAGDPARAVADALANPLGGVSLSDFTGARRLP